MSKLKAFVIIDPQCDFIDCEFLPRKTEDLINELKLYKICRS